MLSGVEEFDREWTAAQALVISRCTSILQSVGMSEQGLQYVRDMKGYPRIPYFTALWVSDAERRRELGVAVCIHAIGIKLLDDLLDMDQPLSRWDQILGVYLLQASAAAVARYEHAGEAMGIFEEDYRVIWRKQIEEMERPADSLESWVGYARVKSGLMLANYAAVATLAGGAKEAVETARIFAEAFGVLFMMGDDLRDYQLLREAGGNLAHLLVTGRISVEHLLEAIGYWQRRAVKALRARPVAADVTKFVEEFAGRLAATVAGLRAEAV